MGEAECNLKSLTKSLEFLLLLACWCSPASPQTPEGCRAQLRHLTVPEYRQAYSTVAPEGHAKLPRRLLFSENGIEVYADTFPDGRDLFLNQVSESGVQVLLVYQDEAVRQAMIKQLREKDALPPPGMGALVDNLKYAKIHFMPDALMPGKPFAEKWHIAHLEYDQPMECMNVFQNDVHPSLGDAYDHSVWAIAQTDEIKDVRLKVDSQAIWSKALEAMLAWVKECASLVDR